jgi:hypothetical protein
MSEIFHIKELDLESINPSTKEMFNPTQGGSKTVVIGKPGTGKCLAKGTRILMFDGAICPVEDVIVGDLLMGDDSTPRRVLSLCSEEDDMFEIEQEYGDNYTVNSAHILSLRKLCDSSATEEDVFENGIIDISVSEFLNLPDRYKYYGFKVKTDFPKLFLEYEIADPFMFGFWVGSRHKYVQIGEETTGGSFKEQMQDLLKKILLPPISLDNVSKFEEYMKEYDLMRHIDHLPRDYKVNTALIRQNFLNGVFEVAVGEDDENFFVKLNSLNLAEDIIFVARSLGHVAFKKSESHDARHEARCESSFYEISISKKSKPFNLTSIKVHPRGRGRYYGFQLDDNHRFLLMDFTVTHNTTLISSLLYAKRHIFPVATVANGSEEFNHFYKSIMPPVFIHNEYSEDLLKNFMKRQKIAKEHLENPWAILLLDDCTDDPKIFNTSSMQSLWKKGRNMKLWFILSLQYAMDVKRVIRVNVDNCFILREPSVAIRKAIWENYASVIPDFTQFCQIMDQVTENYHALYIKNDANSNKVEDCVFYYKATPPPKDFKFGCEDYWKFSDERYNKDYADKV